MTSPYLKPIIILLFVIGVISAGVYFFTAGKEKDAEQSLIETGSVYKDELYNFSFTYPKGFTAGSFSDTDDTHTILVRDGKQAVFAQIFVSGFDEDIVLDEKRIKKELPDLVITDPKTVFIGEVQGIAFTSTNSLSSESREVWFVHKGNLYQVSAPIAQAGLFDIMIQTWKFK